MHTNRLLFLLLTLTLAFGCGDDDGPGNGPGTPDLIDSVTATLNPSTFAPLSATVRVVAQEPVSVRTRVVGANGADSDVIRNFPDANTVFSVPVIGLYADRANTVELEFFTANGTAAGMETITIETAPLIADLPQIDVSTVDRSRISPGFNFVNYFGHNGNFRPQRAFMFDSYGDIRWFLNFAAHPILNQLFYDNGFTFLENGNIVCGDGITSGIYEIDLLGNIVNSWDIGSSGFGFHHHVIEKPNGNLLVTVNEFAKSTVEDVVIELDRSGGGIVNTWDLNTSLQYGRRAWETDLADTDVDWFHGNGLFYSEADDCIIVSGRTQGVVKLTAANEVVWIIAPHRGWGTAGDGSDLKEVLLRPLDASGDPITAAAVLDGAENHPDFSWSWYQHSPVVKPDGNVIIFDNGDNRNYVATGTAAPGAYSRAVEYAIDEENKTIQQVWSYGRERGAELYSRIVSKVLYFPEQNNVFFTPGAVRLDGVNNGKVVEVDRGSGEVVFEATLMAPITPFNITFHNVLRFNLPE